jgi:azurin
MKTPSTRILIASMAGLLLLSACGGTSVSTWTIAPLHPTPTPGPQGSGLASAMPSGMPMPSAGPSGAPASPGTSAGPSGAPASPGVSAPVSPAAGQTITLQLTGSLSITDQNGTAVSNLDVKVGETVHFVIDNTAGFLHDFFIGPPDALSQNQIAGLTGIPQWTSGVQEFDYVVTADTANLQFACSLPGHYPLMHGTFTLVP